MPGSGARAGSKCGLATLLEPALRGSAEASDGLGARIGLGRRRAEGLRIGEHPVPLPAHAIVDRVVQDALDGDANAQPLVWGSLIPKLEHQERVGTPDAVDADGLRALLEDSLPKMPKSNGKSPVPGGFDA
jgi:hypothetical protein